MKQARLIATLNSIGSLVDGLIAELEEDAAAGSGGPCMHPSESVEDCSTFGAESYRCKCGAVSDKPFNTTEE